MRLLKNILLICLLSGLALPSQAFGPVADESAGSLSAPSPQASEFVVIDQNEEAYTVYVGIPEGIPGEALEEIRSAVEKEGEAQIVSWEKFAQDADNYIKAGIVRDEYQNPQLVKGVVELIRRYPGGPFGVTWNGGVALTTTDYQHAMTTYRQYLSNPSEYESSAKKDPRSDPVNPKGHFVPLLGNEYR